MCDFNPLLGDYLDRELSPAEVSRVETHLGECPGCRTALDELKALSNMLGGLPQAALPAGFWERLERRKAGFRPAATRPAWRLPVGARAVGVAFAGLLAVIVVYDKVQVASPIAGAANSLPAIAENDLRLNAPLGAAGGGAGFAAAPVKKAPRARAPGAPIGLSESSDQLAAAAPAAAPETTNEDLQRELERQKRLLGVRQIVAPDRHPMGQFAAVEGSDMEQLTAIPAAPALGGDVADLLKAQSNGPSVAAVRGAAAPAPPAPPAAEGVVVRSETERAQLWSARHIAKTAPRVDYAKQMLVTVFGPSDESVEIRAVTPQADGLHVRYRVSDGSGLPYQFQVVPRSDQPVFFDPQP